MGRWACFPVLPCPAFTSSAFTGSLTYMKFVWQDSYSVGVAEIDDQHRHFFEVVNKVNELLDSNSYDREALISVIVELSDYALLHLSTEEEYFKKFAYEKAETHMLLHDIFRNKIRESIARARGLDADVVKLSAELATFCWEWMLNHILTEDKKYTKCFNEHGLR